MVSALCLLVVAHPDGPRIDLRCVLSPSTPSMTVICTVDVPEQYIQAGNLEFQLSDRMSVPKVRLMPSTVEVVPEKKSQTDHDVKYRIRMPQLAAHKLEFSYESRDTRGFVYMLSPQSCFAGGYNTLWFPSFGDSRRMMGRMVFETPAEFLVKASGREIASSVSGSRRTTEFHVEDPIVPTFAAAPFHVVEVPGKVPVKMYFLNDRPESAAFPDGCRKILDVLEKEFGPYPFPDFSIIETPTTPGLGFSGASFEGFMFADTRSIDLGFNLGYFGHEMSHQWWGNLVQVSGQKGDSVLSEGLAQFGSLLAVRQIDGVDLAKQYRLYGYPEYSDWQCMRGALAYKVNGLDKPLSYEEDGDSQLQHDQGTTKGFLAWQTIALLLGESNFSAALKQITKEKAWSSITWDEVWKDLQKKSPIDLKPYRQQWFEQPGLPTVWTEWKQNGDQLAVQLMQSAPAFRLKMPLVIRYKDGSTQTREVAFDSTEQPLALSTKKAVLSVSLDPDHETLHSTPELDAKFHDLKDFAMADYLTNFVKDPPNAEQLMLNGLKNLPKPDRFATEFLLRYTLGGIYRAGNRNAEAKDQLEKALACPVRYNEFVPSAYLRLARANDALGNKEAVQSCLDAMVASEATLQYPSGAIRRAHQVFPDLKF